MRTIVELPERERDQLDALCRQRGLSRAEAIRQALRLWLQQQQPLGNLSSHPCFNTTH